VRGNRGLLDQVLLNLVVNARDAMPQGGVLRLRTAAASPVRTAAGPGAPAALLEVEDTGSGMSSEVAAHAVEPFYTTKPGSAGPGLGLSTVYGIVRQMGGRLEISSGPGVGTRVRIELPLAAERPAARAAGEARVAPRGRGETVLVVEDEATVRRLATELLASKGYRVIEAGSAEDALAVFDRAANGVDLMLSDVVLPGIDGVELARRLRRSDPGLPVLYMTGYAPETLAERGLGGDDAPVLEKPFTPAQLLVAVRSVLNRRARATGDSQA
jgi:CheY-like chemotaxis protein